MAISSIYTNVAEPADGTGNPYARQARETPAGLRESHEGLLDVTDQARLSSVAPKIQAMLRDMAATEDGVLGTLAHNVDTLQEGFIETLYTVLSGENIDLSQKMTLRLDSANALVVAGEHPDKERAEALFAGNPALSGAFSEIAAQSEVLRDIANISNVVGRQAGMDAYAVAERGASSSAVYRMSLKGEMSHFYFSRE